MKRTPASLAFAAAAGLPGIALCCLLAACDAGPRTDVVPYSSKAVDFYAYGEADGGPDDGDPENDVPAYAPAFTLVYGPTGVLTGRFSMTYAPDDPGRLVRTDCYQYDEAGLNPALIGYDTYEYDRPDAYYESGVPYYRIKCGRSWVPDGESGLERARYDVTYADDGHTTPRQSVHYAEIIDYKWDDAKAAFEATYSQRATWADLDADGALDLDAYGSPTNYQTEQYFAYDDDGANPLLECEYAAYYNAAGEMVNELYHVIRGSHVDASVLPSGIDEGYFYVQYANNQAGLTCLQSDTWYGDPLQPDYALVAPIAAARSAATKAFTLPLAYAIDPLFIGNNADMVMYEYDSAGNPVVDSFYAYGSLVARKTYGWLPSGRLSEKSRYVRGGSVLEQRDCYRYYDSWVDGRKYAAAEVTTYYLDVRPTEGESDFSRTSACLSPRNAAFRDSGFSPVRGSEAETLEAYRQKIRIATRNTHERR